MGTSEFRCRASNFCGWIHPWNLSWIPKIKKNERGTLSSKPPFYILNTVSLISGVYVEKWQTLKDPPSGDYIYHSTWNRWTKGVFVPWKQESSRSSKVLMWHDLTCCFILFGLVHNIQIWTFNFHHGTILGKHSNHFRTPRTSKSWRYPSPSNSHQQDYYIFGKRILGIHNHQDDMNETSWAENGNHGAEKNLHFRQAIPSCPPQQAVSQKETHLPTLLMEEIPNKPLGCIKPVLNSGIN